MISIAAPGGPTTRPPLTAPSVALPAIPLGRIEDPFREYLAWFWRVGLTYAPSRSQIVRLDPPEWAVPKSS
jgi:hypothetical protein